MITEYQIQSGNYFDLKHCETNYISLTLPVSTVISQSLYSESYISPYPNHAHTKAKSSRVLEKQQNFIST